MGQLYHSADFFSYPIPMYFKPELAVPLVFSTTCVLKAWCKQEKKKVWVHGLMQRVHPRLVGSSRKS